MTFLTRHRIFEKRYARQFNKSLQKQIMSYPDIDNDPLEKVYQKMYLDIMQSEGHYTWNALVAPMIGRDKLGRKDFTDVVAEMEADTPMDDIQSMWSNLMTQYISLYLQLRINQVTQTTVKQIQAQIPDFEELTRSEQLEALRAHARVQELRANTIARTETTNAMSKSQMVALKSSGGKWEKIWRGILDDRTREIHVAEQISAEWIPLDEFFNVGGEMLLYPGDTVNGNASAKNLVNCRCWLEYRLIQGSVGFRQIRR